MVKRLQMIVLSLIMPVLALSGGLLYASPVHAQGALEAVCEGASLDGSTGNCKNDSSGSTLTKVIKMAIRLFQTIVGVISLFVLSIAGLNYITSGGDSGKTKTAKDRILYAAVGLTVVALAEVIVRFVLDRVATA